MIQDPVYKIRLFPHAVHAGTGPGETVRKACTLEW